jgi:hypothetical protein
MAIEILTADEVGELIRFSANRVLALARRGEIPYLTIDGHVRFDARDIEDWLRSRRSDVAILPGKLIDVTEGQSPQTPPKKRGCISPAARPVNPE